MENRERYVDQQREKPKAAPGETRLTKPAVAGTTSGDTRPGEGHNSLPEAAALQTPEGDGYVPVEVFDRITELERQLQEAQAKLGRQRERKNAQQQRWRERHREHV